MYANHLCNGLLTIPQSSAGADRSDLKDTGELYGVSHTVNHQSSLVLVAYAVNRVCTLQIRPVCYSGTSCMYQNNL